MTMSRPRIAPRVWKLLSVEMARRGDGVMHPEHLVIAAGQASVLKNRVSASALRRQVDSMIGPPSTSKQSAGGMNDTTSQLLANAGARAELRGVQSIELEDVLAVLVDRSEGSPLAVVVFQALDIDVAELRKQLEPADSPGAS